MGVLDLFTMEGRSKEIAHILADTIDKQCKDDSMDDIIAALHILEGVAVLKADANKKEGTK